MFLPHGDVLWLEKVKTDVILVLNRDSLDIRPADLMTFITLCGLPLTLLVFPDIECREAEMPAGFSLL